jgi:hypothetical protein
MAVRTTLALVATLMLAGDCTSRSTGADPGADSGGGPAAGTSTRADSLVSVAVSAPTLRPGAPVRITVTVRNAGAAPLALETPTACVTDYEVLDAAGTVVAQSGLMCLQALTTTTLAPGARRDDVFTLSLDGLGAPRLAAGRYAVRGVLSLMSAPRRSAAVPLDVAP